jgi:hypothetical protein
MKHLLLLLSLSFFALNAQQDLTDITSTIETNYYANVYGYNLEVNNDSIYVTSKQRIAAINIMSKLSDVNYWHKEYNRYNMAVPLINLPKGNYIIALRIKQSFIINILNHKTKSLKK